MSSTEALILNMSDLLVVGIISDNDDENPKDVVSILKQALVRENNTAKS